MPIGEYFVTSPSFGLSCIYLLNILNTEFIEQFNNYLNSELSNQVLILLVMSAVLSALVFHTLQSPGIQTSAFAQNKFQCVRIFFFLCRVSNAAA